MDVKRKNAYQHIVRSSTWSILNWNKYDKIKKLHFSLQQINQKRIVFRFSVMKKAYRKKSLRDQNIIQICLILILIVYSIQNKKKGQKSSSNKIKD